MTRVLAVALLSLLVLGALVPAPAAADDVSKTIVAKDFQFHIDSATGATSPTIDIEAGSTLRLRVENQDGAFHTFTVPHFGIDRALDNGSASQPFVIFVNITTTNADLGTWQFWCRPHSSGPNPENHTGMIGRIHVETGHTTPPPTPGFEAVAVLAAIVIASAVVAVAVRVRRR